ncbi:MAG: glutathione peroxidase, partial [Ignavibacteriaceae bacterium]|jgi:glutathione peroxidase|nr:glutathione peroxidase [Ignavibacteriaceae bacterium]
MYIKVILITVFLFLIQIAAQNNPKNNIKGDDLTDNINDITVLDMNNKEVKLSTYNGKVLLIVNVASECGNTPQYAGLEEIYKEFQPGGFEVLAFPCNDFGGQEPGTNEQIQSFCTSNYGVTFPLFDKVKILGPDKSPLYAVLTDNSVTGKGDVKWNFEKFLISKDGKIVARFGNKVQPTSDEIISAIESQLKK